MIIPAEQLVANTDCISFTKIQKRDGRIVTFNASKITSAILKAGRPLENSPVIRP